MMTENFSGAHLIRFSVFFKPSGSGKCILHQPPGIRSPLCIMKRIRFLPSYLHWTSTGEIDGLQRCSHSFIRWEMRLSRRSGRLWMCDHSNRLIAVWNGQPSRTANTIRYTQKIGSEVVFSNRTHGSIKFKYGDSLPDCDKVWHLFCSQDRKNQVS